MNTIFKKIALATVFAGISIVSHAADNGNGRYYVNGIIPNSQVIQSNLMQSVTGKNNSCGPTSLLFIDNHYVRQYTGSSPAHLMSVANSKLAINRLYNWLDNKPEGAATIGNRATSLAELKSIAKDKWGYSRVIRMTESDGIVVNVDRLIGFLSQDTPTLAIMNGDYSGYPLPGKRTDHIVILFAYNRMQDNAGRWPLDPNNTHENDIIEYYEPYYGIMGRILRKDISKAFNMAGFAFLAVGR